MLVPQPSSDVNDPLRWPTWKKNTAFLNICFFAFMTTGFVGGFSPALYSLSLEFNKDLSTSTGLILWCLLISGIGVSLKPGTGGYFQNIADQISEEFLLGANCRVLRQTTCFCDLISHIVLLHHLVCCLKKLPESTS